MDRTFAFRVKWQYQWKKSSVIFCKDNKELVAKIQEQLPNAEVVIKTLHTFLCIDYKCFDS
jgi:hypothetical protein